MKTKKSLIQIFDELTNYSVIRKKGESLREPGLILAITIIVDLLLIYMTDCN